MTSVLLGVFLWQLKNIRQDNIDNVYSNETLNRAVFLLKKGLDCMCCFVLYRINKFNFL